MKSYLITMYRSSPALELFERTLGCHCLPVEELPEGEGFRFIVAAEEAADVPPNRIGGEEKRRLEMELSGIFEAAALKSLEYSASTGYFHSVPFDPQTREKIDELRHRLEVGTKSQASIFNPLTVGFVERHLPWILDRLGRLGAGVRSAPLGFYKCPIVGVDFFITEDGGALIPFDIEAGAKARVV